MTDVTHDTIIEEKIKNLRFILDDTIEDMESYDEASHTKSYEDELFERLFANLEQFLRSALQEAYTKGKEDTAREILAEIDRTPHNPIILGQTIRALYDKYLPFGLFGRRMRKNVYYYERR